MRKRGIQIPIRLNPDEYDALLKRVEKTGMTRERYIRLLLNDTVPREAPPVDYYTLICELRRVGSNINQLLKVAYSQNLVDVPLLRKTLDDYHKTEQMIWQAFSPEKS